MKNLRLHANSLLLKLVVKSSCRARRKLQFKQFGLMWCVYQLIIGVDKIKIGWN